MTLMKFEEAALEEATELLKVEGQTVSINKRLLGLILEIAKSNKTVYLKGPFTTYPQPTEVPIWNVPHINPTDPIYKDFESRGKIID